MNRKYRHTIIAGNWKMNMLASDVKHYADELRTLTLNSGKWCDIVICAPYTALYAAVKAFKGNRVSTGAQNINENASGAFTGEVSGAQLRDLGIGFVIVGHSERRDLYGETDYIVAKKLRAALDNQLRPILCVGESITQREMNVTSEVVTLQVKSALAGLSTGEMRRIVIAYEPVWAIGTGRTASAEEAQSVCREIRGVVRSIFDARTARAVSIIYGGSMNNKNAFELLAQPDIDGGLIGGASLSPETFAAIINAANQP